MEQIVIPLEAENPERDAVGVIDKRNVPQRAEDKEHRRIQPRKILNCKKFFHDPAPLYKLDDPAMNSSILRVTLQ